MSKEKMSFATPFMASAAEESREFIEAHLKRKQKELQQLPPDADPLERARIQLDIAEAQVGLNQGAQAWINARAAFQVFLDHEDWEMAVRAADALYQTGQPASLQALGHGVWLAVTFPVDPNLTLQMLSYIIDETPPNADGAAVAAVTGRYIADLRASDEDYENLEFLTRQQLVQVAERHSNVSNQEELDAWLDRLELRDPAVFLKRLALVVGAIVGEEWWFDRDQLRAKLPE